MFFYVHSYLALRGSNSLALGPAAVAADITLECVHLHAQRAAAAFVMKKLVPANRCDEACMHHVIVHCGYHIVHKELGSSQVTLRCIAYCCHCLQCLEDGAMYEVDYNGESYTCQVILEPCCMACTAWPSKRYHALRGSTPAQIFMWYLRVT